MLTGAVVFAKTWEEVGSGRACDMLQDDMASVRTTRMSCVLPRDERNRDFSGTCPGHVPAGLFKQVSTKKGIFLTNTKRTSAAKLIEDFHSAYTLHRHPASTFEIPKMSQNQDLRLKVRGLRSQVSLCGIFHYSFIFIGGFEKSWKSKLFFFCQSAIFLERREEVNSIGRVSSKHAEAGLLTAIGFVKSSSSLLLGSLFS